MQANTKKDIRSFSKKELETFMQSIGQPAFRGRQVYDWLWKNAVHQFAEMTNLSAKLRQQLDDTFEIRFIKIHTEQKSNDGTMKFAFQLHDKNLIEGVLIPAGERMTACVSSQVGCSLSCKFCATGYMGRKRNLNHDEIFDQFILLNRKAIEHFDKPLTNIVFMGMGEPLLNYSSVLNGIEMITHPETQNFSPKRITVSTAGIAKMINKLADDKVRFNLALSLHATNDQKRNEIMPINEHNNLQTLIENMLYFYRKTGNKMTFEYILLKDFNDGPEDAEELIELCKKVPAKINVIEYNPIDEADFEKTDETNRERFIRYLERARITAKVRRSRGKDIAAACGQLANKVE